VSSESDEFFDEDEARRRAFRPAAGRGRGYGPDLEKDDVGIDGGAASAEEATVYIVEP
jgi:hypothetical protein